VATSRDCPTRKSDVISKLETEQYVWVPSADGDGHTHLVPLSFHWDGGSLWWAVAKRSRTSLNLQRAGEARRAVGTGDDVVIMEGNVTVRVPGELDGNLRAAFHRQARWDPFANADGNVFFELTPKTVMAWRDESEIADRHVMVRGAWRC